MHRKHKRLNVVLQHSISRHLAVVMPMTVQVTNGRFFSGKISYCITGCRRLH
jgi:hypothetical protein